MANRFLLIYLLFAAFFAAGPARADECATEYELIFNMKKAEYGSYNIWNSVYGGADTDERFISGVVLDSGNTVALGERMTAGAAGIEILLVEFEKRGRTVWEEARKIEGLRSLRKILLVPGGFLVFGEKRDAKKKSSVWLGFFDDKGHLVSDKVVSDAKSSLFPEDIIPALGGKGYLLSASAGNDAGSIQGSVIYKIDSKGRVAARHAYKPGLENRILSIAPLGKDFYMASGYLRGDDGRKTGWLMKLNPDGGVVWQRQYPRGASAQLSVSSDLIYDYVLAAGVTTPSGNQGNRAAWVMMVDGTGGNVVWQRFYTGELHYEAKNILTAPGGIASILVTGQKPDRPEEGSEEYIRLLTINPRGILLISDEYFSAEGAQGAQVMEGNAGERIVFGTTRSALQVEGAKPGEEPVIKRSLDGWVFAATGMETYKDPCVQSYSFMP